jgi:hypothetical protein
MAGGARIQVEESLSWRQARKLDAKVQSFWCGQFADERFLTFATGKRLAGQRTAAFTRQSEHRCRAQLNESGVP